jgi:hypothetical protein
LSVFRDPREGANAVVLFIDRLPLQYRVIQSAGRRRRAWYPLVPAILADSVPSDPPREAKGRPWKFDTGCALDACAWRFHLDRSGLDLTNSDRFDPNTAAVRAANDAVEALPIRRACLWLVSNIPALRELPYPLYLDPGVPYYDRAPRRPEYLYPLLGMRAFRRAGLTVKINFAAATLSIWMPGPWYSGLSQLMRRIPGCFATVAFEQLCEEWH